MSALPAPATVVSAAKCSCCGKSVEVKLNKNRNAYYYCPWSDEYGNPCSHHERWGKSASRKFVEAYLAGKQVAPAQPVKTPVAANIPTAPKPKLVQSAPDTPKPAQKQPTGTYEDYLR